MTVVIPEGDPAETEESAHAAAVAEGAAIVHEENAEDAAAEAAAAAAVATEAAAANLETAAGTADAAFVAESSAADAGAARDAVLEALTAQTAALSSLTEELRMSREQAATPVTPAAPTKQKADRAPKERKGLGSRYYGRLDAPAHRSTRVYRLRALLPDPEGDHPTPEHRSPTLRKQDACWRFGSFRLEGAVNHGGWHNRSGDAGTG